METPQVSDDDRQKLEAAIAAALTLLYLGRYRDAAAALGVADVPTELSAAAQEAINTFAAERAALVQSGTNERLTDAVAALPEGSSERDVAAAIEQTLASAAEHNAETLQPYIERWGTQQGLIGLYRDQPSVSGDPSKTAADDVPWEWSRYTSNPPSDPCQEAADASPAPLDDLLALAGGTCPSHDGCLCDLQPVNESATGTE